MTTAWDAFLAQYLEAREKQDYDAIDGRIRDDILPHTSVFTSQDSDWFIRALDDAQKKWFVALVFDVTPRLPDDVFEPLLRAGVHERNPSLNRWFIEPCLKSFGTGPVIRALLDILEGDSNSEKAGAANALYWANVLPYHDNSGHHRLDKEPGDEFKSILVRQRNLVLQEFILNPDIHVRRSLVSRLNLDSQVYPDHLKPLVEEAITIARNHSDDYIRHRIEVELGNVQVFYPLPERE
jgi:hypothetical protein